MDDFGSRWSSAARRALCVVALALCNVSSGVAKETAARVDEGASALSPAIVAFEALRNDLGFEPSPFRAAELNALTDALARAKGLEPEDVRRGKVPGGTAQSLLTALCAIALPERAAVEDTCLHGIDSFVELRQRVEQGQDLLAKAAARAGRLHDDAYAAFVKSLFDQIVCRSGAKVPCANREATRAWWETTGTAAIMALDRLGREQIKLSKRVVDSDVENARTYLHARLNEVLRREDVKMAVRALVNANADDSAFHALQNPKNRTEALNAVTAVSSWIQTTISKLMESEIETRAEESSEMRILASALVEGNGRAPAIDRLLAKFEAYRQRMVEIVAIGTELGQSTECRLPDLAALLGQYAASRDHEPELGIDEAGTRALGKAIDGIGQFVNSCPGDVSRGSFATRLERALREAAPPVPSQTRIAQSLCRFSRAVPDAAAPLRSIFVAELPPTLSVFLSPGSKELCKAIATLPSRRDLTAKEFEERVDAAADEAGKQELRAAMAAIATIEADARDRLKAALDRRAADLWAIGRLLGDELLQRVTYAGSEAMCTGSPLSLVWSIEHPVLKKSETGLVFEATAELALCRPVRMVERESIASGDPTTSAQASTDRKSFKGATLWPLAEGKDPISIDLAGLFRERHEELDLDKAAQALRTHFRKEVATKFSFTFDKRGMEAVARRALKRDRREITAQTIEERIRENLAKALVQVIPIDSLAQFMNGADISYDLTEDARGLVVRLPFAVADISEEVCIVLPMSKSPPVIPDGCTGSEGVGEHTWKQAEDRIRRQLLKRLARTLVPVLSELSTLESEFATLVGHLERGIANEDGSIALSVARDKASLTLKMPDAIKSLSITLPKPMAAEDVSGRLRAIHRFDTDAPHVTATPSIDVVAVARRVFPHAVEAAAPILSLSELPFGKKSACKHHPGVAAAFGTALPLEGPIGALCWRQGKFDFVPPADRSIDLTIAAAGMKLVVDRRDIDGKVGGPEPIGIVGEMEVTGAEDPWGFSDARLQALLSLDLMAGTLTVPANEKENAPPVRSSARKGSRGAARGRDGRAP